MKSWEDIHQKLIRLQVWKNQARICVGCQNSCFLTSCKGSCSSTCTGTGISRPAVRKEVEK